MGRCGRPPCCLCAGVYSNGGWKWERGHWPGVGARLGACEGCACKGCACEGCARRGEPGSDERPEPPSPLPARLFWACAAAWWLAVAAV